MAEPLTLELIGELLSRLRAAFPRSTRDPAPATTVEVYRNGLRGLSGAAVRAAVERVIQEDEFFPKVARLREIAQAWQRVNEAQASAQGEVDPLWCPGCQTRATWRTRWRPAVDERRRVLLSRDGEYVLLERFDRLLCACAPASQYTPDEGITPPAARVTTLEVVDPWRARDPRGWFVRSDVQPAAASRSVDQHSSGRPAERTLTEIA